VRKITTKIIDICSKRDTIKKCNGHMSITKGVMNMPRRDGTGPIGSGAMTGRNLGVCTGVYADRNGGEIKGGLGMRLGHGLRRSLGLGLKLGLEYGCRRGYGRYFGANTTEVSEKALLHEQKELLESKLDIISKQLKSLE
jgi:hypothetical protein